MQVTPQAAGTAESAESHPLRPHKPVQTTAFGNRRAPPQQHTQIVFRLALVPAAGWVEDLPAARVISGQKLGAKQAPTGSTGHLSSLVSWEGERGAGAPLWRRALTLVPENPKAPTPSTKELAHFLP